MDRLARAQLTQERWQQRRWRKTAGTVGVQQTWRPSTRIGSGDRILRQYTPRVSSFGPEGIELRKCGDAAPRGLVSCVRIAACGCHRGFEVLPRIQLCGTKCSPPKFNQLTCSEQRKTEMICVSVQSVARRPSIVALLRSRTRDAHSALEAQLGLLDQPASTEYYARLLLRFLEFHLVWEQGLQAFPALARELKTRSRLQQLRHDLKALGLADAEISRVPLCSDAHRVTTDEARALGSFYVLE